MPKPSNALCDNNAMITTPQDQKMDASQIDTEMNQASKPIVSPLPVEEVQTPPTLPQNTNGGMFKRPRPKGLTKHSIHRPFKSPLKSPTITTIHAPISVKASASSRNPRVNLAKEPTRQTPGLLSTKSRTPLPKPKTRPQFRSPFPRNSDHNPSSAPTSQSHQKTSASRFLEIKDLESKINDLRSSIRNCTMVLRHQEKKEDPPLEELIAKWKRVSQEGAQALMEKMVEQEQVFGEARGYNSYYGRLFLGQGSGYSGSSGYGGFGSWDENQDPQARLEMIKERMDYEDNEQDLPTVSEAVHSRMWPEVSLPKPPTKMQRLLAGLGIDLDTIGYDPETDSFALKED